MTMLLIQTSWPGRDVAMVFARRVLQMRLAACVHIGAPLQALYRWQGNIEEAEEYPLQIKTSQACYKELEAEILLAHPYDIPEIIVLPVKDALPAYMNWLTTEIQPGRLDVGDME